MKSVICNGVVCLQITNELMQIGYTKITNVDLWLKYEDLVYRRRWELIRNDASLYVSVRERSKVPLDRFVKHCFFLCERGKRR